MGLERRGNGLYYYRKVRCGDRIVSEYVGGGLVALATALRDGLARENRRSRRESWDARRAVLDDRESEAVALFDEVEALAREAIEAAGYHRHKRGEWRKRRAHERSDVPGSDRPGHEG